MDFRLISVLSYNLIHEQIIERCIQFYNVFFVSRHMWQKTTGVWGMELWTLAWLPLQKFHQDFPDGLMAFFLLSDIFS